MLVGSDHVGLFRPHVSTGVGCLVNGIHHVAVGLVSERIPGVLQGLFLTSHGARREAFLLCSLAPTEVECKLLFNVEINLRCGPVLNYLLAVQFHF